MFNEGEKVQLIAGKECTI